MVKGSKDVTCIILNNIKNVGQLHT